MDILSPMSAIRHSTDAPAVGVDLGGTWVRLLATVPGRRPARRTLPSKGLPELAIFLRSVWKKQFARRRVAALVVAARGVWTPAERRALARRLAGLADRVVVLSDAQAALLGALDGGAGVLVLAGTGSIVIGRDARGRWARAGGFGPLVGDEGSGFWLGREWLRASTRGDDFERLRRLVHAPNPVARIAALAPGVIRRARHGDRRARAIVTDGQRHLAALTRTVVSRLGLPAPVRASWAGSVLGDPWFRAGLVRAVAAAGVRARWQPPAHRPVVAAARLAEALARPRRPRR
jgi:hypothetical protein